MSTVCTSTGPRKALYRKAEDAAQRVLDAFKVGNLPKPLAAIFIRRKRRFAMSGMVLVESIHRRSCRLLRRPGIPAMGASRAKGEEGREGLSDPLPLRPQRTEKNEETGKEEERSYVYGFTSAPVFGFEQTEGADLPTGDAHVDEWFRSLPLRGVAESWGLSLGTFNGEKADYLGYYKHGQGIAWASRTWLRGLMNSSMLPMIATGR